MGKDKFRRMFFFLFITTFCLMLSITVRTTTMPGSILKPPKPPNTCPLRISEQSITRLNNIEHLLVSAYMDQRVKGFHLRIIAVFKIDSIQPLHCVLCCTGQSSTPTPAKILIHSENFSFPFVTTDVMCKIPETCSTTHVSLQARPDRAMAFNQTWLPIRNQKTEGREEKKLQFDFTVCVSTLFGGYNNVLQFAQSLEMYRLLGVDRVVIYNTSCGPDLDRLLRSYQQEGFVEIVPWPIDRHLNPSRGWKHSVHGGDLHYYGQITTLNECIYRSMDSHYVLLHDIDEIMMPYKHDSLKPLMDMLQQQHPHTGVFLVENHIFPRKHFEPSGRFHLPRWNRVPGVNILEHIYREDPARNKYHPYKMIIQPRMVEQTSVHAVLKSSGKKYKVPLDVCRLIHVRTPLQGTLTREQLIVDKRLWDFSEKLIPNVDKGLRRAGLLSSEGQS